jgi:hypothetical protein
VKSKKDKGEPEQTDGPRLELEGYLCGLPVYRTDAWIRELPRPVNTLCIGEPRKIPLFEDIKTQALYAVICGETALNLDLARGGFVCDKHITEGWTLTSCGELGHLIKQCVGGHCEKKGPDVWLAAKTLAAIEQRLYLIWRAANPRKRRAKHFPLFYADAWKRIAATLTYQVRLTTERYLIRSDN